MDDNQDERLEQVLTSFLVALDKQQSKLNRIESILLGAQPELVGSDFVFETMIRDIDDLKKDVAILKRLFLSPE